MVTVFFLFSSSVRDKAQRLMTKPWDYCCALECWRFKISENKRNLAIISSAISPYLYQKKEPFLKKFSRVNHKRFLMLLCSTKIPKPFIIIIIIIVVGIKFTRKAELCIIYYARCVIIFPTKRELISRIRRQIGLTPKTSCVVDVGERLLSGKKSPVKSKLTISSLSGQREFPQKARKICRWGCRDAG